MNCEEATIAYSAMLDRELGALEQRRLELHLTSCVGCRAFADSADLLQRRIRIRTAEPVPDLTVAILSRSSPTRPGRGGWVQYALAVVALTELAMAAPALFLADATGTSAHQARHLGAMSFAVALGLLYTSWRPQRAYGVMLIAAALAFTMGVTGAIDVARGVTPLLGESEHVLELIGFVLVWMLAGSPGLPRLRPRQRAGRSHDADDDLTIHEVA